MSCEHHNYTKYHPDEDCSVCYWEKQKALIIRKHPNWSDKLIEESLDRISDKHFQGIVKQ